MSEAVLNLTLLLSYLTGSFSCETILTCTLEDVVSRMLTICHHSCVQTRNTLSESLKRKITSFKMMIWKQTNNLNGSWVNEISDKEVKSLQILENSLPPYVYVRTRNREMVTNHRESRWESSFSLYFVTWAKWFHSCLGISAWWCNLLYTLKSLCAFCMILFS